MKYFLKDVVNAEKTQLLLRRKKLGIEHSGPGPDGANNLNWFGIALSGGGIRSATINLGFLKTLNRFGILEKADYLSTVSGGGYTHSYIQVTAKEVCSFDKLFTEEHAARFRQHGEYMIPGQGLWKYVNGIMLAVAFVVSWLMSLVSPLVMGGILFYLYKIVEWVIGENSLHGEYMPDTERIAHYAVYFLGGLFVLHFLSNVLLNFNLSVSKIFNRIETALAAIGLGFYAWVLITGFEGIERGSADTLLDYAINAVLLFIIGFFTNPNALSFHRYYRKQLADLYLKFAGAYQNMPLKDVFNAQSDNKKDFIAPYPIVNTCLNLQNPSGDEKFKGVKASDYFILSPLFCGSKLTAYVKTEDFGDYRKMTLPAAVTVSAAAVNPGMGVYSNKMLSVMMTMFNARLGFWIANPLKLGKTGNLVWWPIYFFKELLGRIGTNNRKVNISDGGHIENLGAYELLRRGCRLIIAFDAGEDKIYSFADLNNLIIRARNELGLEIRFRDGYQPESTIRPEPSRVYSQRRFALADIYQWWEDRKIIKDGKEIPDIENFTTPRKVGTFVYVKSSVTAPTGKPFLDEKADRLKYGTYKYKIYHPDFPHEPTSDQFFDEIQWEAYYQLGQYIGADLLGIDNLQSFENQSNAPDFSVEQLIDWFDDPAHFPLFQTGVPRAAAPPSDEFESMKPSYEAAPAATLPPAPPAEEVQYRM